MSWLEISTRAWCIVTRRGALLLSTVRPSAEQAWDALRLQVAGIGADSGYQAIAVQVTPARPLRGERQACRCANHGECHGECSLPAIPEASGA